MRANDTALWRYVDTLSVPCHTPAGLLARARLRPQAVSALVMDVEGFDVQLAEAFLRVPLLRPRLIGFEVHIALERDPQSVLRLTTELHRRGFGVMCCLCGVDDLRHTPPGLKTVTAVANATHRRNTTCDSGWNFFAWDTLLQPSLTPGGYVLEQDFIDACMGADKKRRRRCDRRT